VKVASVINQKGGVGKTTTAMNLAAALAEGGRKVLLIDLDPQSNLTAHMGCEPGPDDKTIYDVLTGAATAAAAVRKLAEPNLSCIPATLDLSAAELELAGEVGREMILRDALATLAADPATAFDLVVIDCAPSLGLLSLNALVASAEVLVPVQTEFFALAGIARLVEVVQLVQKRLNPKVRIAGIVACKVDRRPKLSQEVLDELRRHFTDVLYDTVIRPNVKLAEAPSHGQSVLKYAPDSHGAEDYRALAAEYLMRTGAVAAKPLPLPPPPPKAAPARVAAPKPAKPAAPKPAPPKAAPAPAPKPAQPAPAQETPAAQSAG
jgi:chromosome partitioning protein